MSLVKLVPVLSLLFLTTFVQAQRGEIYGVVTEAETGEPAMFCNHTLILGGEIVAQTAGDDMGKYYFSALRPGTYTMITSTVEFANDTAIIILKRSAQLAVNIELGGTMLIEIPIYGNKVIDTSAPEVESFPIAELRRKPIGSIAEVPALAAKVYDRDGTGGSINVAGSRDNANLLIIDGVRVDGSFSLPMAAVSEVRVITGGIPARYGDFTGGVIEVFTKQSILID